MLFTGLLSGYVFDRANKAGEPDHSGNWGNYILAVGMAVIFLASAVGLLFALFHFRALSNRRLAKRLEAYKSGQPVPRALLRNLRFTAYLHQ